MRRPLVTLTLFGGFAGTIAWFYAASPGVDPARIDTRDLPKAS